MKDCAAAIQQAYYDRLNVSGLWHCFDRPQGTELLPYNLIESIVTQDNSTKDSRGQIVVVTVSANAGYTGDAGGKKEVAQQAALILEALDNRSNRLDCSIDFHIVSTVFENASGGEEQRTEPTNLIRRILRFRHEVEELAVSP